MVSREGAATWAERYVTQPNPILSNLKRHHLNQKLLRTWQNPATIPEHLTSILERHSSVELSCFRQTSRLVHGHVRTGHRSICLHTYTPTHMKEEEESIRSLFSRPKDHRNPQYPLRVPEKDGRISIIIRRKAAKKSWTIPKGSRESQKDTKSRPIRLHSDWPQKRIPGNPAGSSAMLNKLKEFWKLWRDFNQHFEIQSTNVTKTSKGSPGTAKESPRISNQLQDHQETAPNPSHRLDRKIIRFPSKTLKIPNSPQGILQNLSGSISKPKHPSKSSTFLKKKSKESFGSTKKDSKLSFFTKNPEGILKDLIWINILKNPAGGAGLWNDQVLSFEAAFQLTK